jgi:hypothetical protein
VERHQALLRQGWSHQYRIDRASLLSRSQSSRSLVASIRNFERSIDRARRQKGNTPPHSTMLCFGSRRRSRLAASSLISRTSFAACAPQKCRKDAKPALSIHQLLVRERNKTGSPSSGMCCQKVRIFRQSAVERFRSGSKTIVHARPIDARRLTPDPCYTAQSC